MAGVLVFGKATGGVLAADALEVAAAGAGLATALGEPLLGALIADDAGAAVDAFGGGFAKLYVVQGAHYQTYTADSCLAAAQAVIAACAPSVVLFAHNLETREWVPRLAAGLQTGLVLDCTALATEDGELLVTKPVYGGGVIGQFVLRGAPRLVTVRGGVFEPRTAQQAAGEVVRLDVAAPTAGPVTFVEAVQATAAGGPSLKDAERIVSGGRGLGGPDNWHYIEEAAAVLDAAVGCSRPVADSGWVSSSHQVGLSGTLVKPQLYIAVGISGAVQHLAGISAAKTVVAINTDAAADIFTRADYGVVGDYREVLPAFVERVKQLRG